MNAIKIVKLEFEKSSNSLFGVFHQSDSTKDKSVQVVIINLWWLLSDQKIYETLVVRYLVYILIYSSICSIYKKHFFICKCICTYLFVL